ncbi:hypothetical protein ASC77_11405 [Nocardioides sp. Root1257]|uniref:hypothetical protein n=1 Tax=unclassified Nocardioides TaxID=2615069 RepID=UPI0006F34D7B|nr:MULTISPECIES: hypothetical protein [unclassified Nocardioides]KQW49285.1 hypothetical protein ASC77_11405 [Nocardioides sp. Root1257]KRC48459.1 hypothetical protein ASE24_11410 [Nocardioides sp. Root224]
MSAVRRALVALAALVLATAAAGCTSDGDDGPSADRPSASSTPLQDFATDDVSVVRGEFCPRIAPEAVTDALGSESTDGTTWANGDRVELADGVRDVAHEYGCSWTAADGTVARAWVFAPPVTAAGAADLGRRARGADGCRALPDAPAYGAPSVATRCGDVVTFQGLFGDAWLTCSLSSTTEPDVDRTGRWCVAVAQAARS